MKTSCDWLSDFLPTRPDPASAGELLTMAGYPVEEVERVGEDDVMEVEITSNRPDLLCHVGIARELAAIQDLVFRQKESRPPESAEPAADATSVKIEASDLCPHYTARLIRGVKIGPSPQWMQTRLTAVGLRPINNVVDVTNYVLFETGQPLHAFDFDQLAGGRIVVRTAVEGEKLVTLDDVDRKLTPDTLCICDAEKPVALAGVMGGRDSEVTAATTNILLEAARFDPISVRATSRRLKLFSDAAHRFERGLDPTLAVSAGRRAAELILETAGGTLLNGYAEAGGDDWSPRTLHLRFAALEKLLGVSLPHEQVVGALLRLHLNPVREHDGVTVDVPPHRQDLNLEVDLIEEVARIVGYDAIPTRQQITVTVQPADPAIEAKNLIRATLVAGGYFEAVTFSFVSDVLRDDFLPRGCTLRRVDPATRKADGHLRPSVLPGLCESLRYNETVGNGSVRLFETGSAFYRDADGSPIESFRLAFAGGEDYAGGRGMLELVLNRLDADRPIRVEPAGRAGFGEGACGRVFWGEAEIGYVGKLARPVADKLDLRILPAACELDLDALIDGYRPVPTLRPLPRSPAARRDVSLAVADAVRYDQLAALATELQLDDLEAVEHAATYKGKPLAADQKSVTLTLVFRREGATVSREEADAAIARLSEARRRTLRRDRAAVAFPNRTAARFED